MLKNVVPILVPTDFLKIAGKEYSTPKSAFKSVEIYPQEEIHSLTSLYNKDKCKQKVNLCATAYRTDEGKPFVLPIVKHCEREIIRDIKINHEHLPILGNSEFCELSTQLILGEDSKAMHEGRVQSIQTLSGTGAIRLGAEFLCKHLKRRTIYISYPSCCSHYLITQQSGFKHIKSYTYWNAKKGKISVDQILCELAEAPENAVVLFHTCAHNPTGMDPTKKQWKQLAEVVKQKRLFPFYDASHQGLASGDPDVDVWPIRYFEKKGLEMLIAQSFSYNMGLYSARIGNLIVVMHDNKCKSAVKSQLETLARVNYSTPPAFGSRIVAKVLGDQENRKEWLATIRDMVDRVRGMKKAMVKKLQKLKTPGKWDHIVNSCGFYSYLGLESKQIKELRVKKHIYILHSGRANIGALTPKNIDYVVESIDKIVKSTSKD